MTWSITTATLATCWQRRQWHSHLSASEHRVLYLCDISLVSSTLSDPCFISLNNPQIIKQTFFFVTKEPMATELQVKSVRVKKKKKKKSYVLTFICLIFTPYWPRILNWFERSFTHATLSSSVLLFLATVITLIPELFSKTAQ